MNSTPSEPSYGMSAVAGFFLGLLGMTAMILFKGAEWLGWVIPPFIGLGAGIIGAYIAAEPYAELRENYDRLIAELAESEHPPREFLASLKDTFAKEALRLGREAAERGADGEKIAEAAEVLRLQAEKIESEMKRNDTK
ncbi:MAG: hypothetical protein D6679_02365 [Candidatus Hydrogenedentota bacterium]|nr:MAG: hypothetical protein D6679_02365 [Candidatus Hydrogenedentota bacterium]